MQKKMSYYSDMAINICFTILRAFPRYERNIFLHYKYKISGYENLQPSCK